MNAQKREIERVLFISFSLTKINLGDLLLDIINIEKQLMKARVCHDRFKSSR